MTPPQFDEPDQKDKQPKSSGKGEIPPEYLGSVLRAEIMPADEVAPDRSRLTEYLQRVNFRRIGMLLILFVLIAATLVCMIGPGKPILENSLAKLKSRYIDPTTTSTQENIAESQETPTPQSTPTVQLTRTPTRIQPSRTPTELPTIIPTEDDSCTDAIDITLVDVGNTLCVRGIVNGYEEREVGFLVYFSDQRGVFYLVSYDLVWDEADPGDCIQITGEIQQLGNTPVLVFGWSNIPEICP